VILTLGESPDETTHWTGRLMAKVAGVSLTSVQRIWRAYGLAPHRVRTSKASRPQRNGSPASSPTPSRGMKRRLISSGTATGPTATRSLGVLQLWASVITRQPPDRPGKTGMRRD
jgi:hypothetical protein